MWKRGGRSSALDRAQALLRETTANTRTHTGAVGEPVKARSAPSNTHRALSDVTEPSSVSSMVSSRTQDGVHTVGSAAAGRTTRGREGDSTQDVRPDLRPASSVDGGGSRFLKKAPPPATNSSQSPVRKGLLPEHRYVSSSQPGSQALALSRLAQIERSVLSHRDGQDQDPSRSVEAPGHLLAQASIEQGQRFLKNNSYSAAAAGSPKGPGAGGRSGSQAADAGVLSVGPVRPVSGVSVDSDEEDMRKLFGDSLDSIDNSFFIGRPSSISTTNKMLSQKVHFKTTGSSTSNPALPLSPASPPFRFSGQAQAHLSPSALSLSPSPPRRSSMGASPQRSLSSMSGRSELLSLEELFPVRPASEDPHSDMSEVYSEDFNINVMTLDDLVPANIGLTEESPGQEREAKAGASVPASPSRPQQVARLKEEEEGDMLPDYHSDFESESRTEAGGGASASQVSEHLHRHGDGDGEEAGLDDDVTEKASQAEDDYTSDFSQDSRRSHTSQTSDGSGTLSRSRSSMSSASQGSQSSSPPARRQAPTTRLFKEAAVQTQPDQQAHTWPHGVDTLGPEASMAYVRPSPLLTHTLSADMVEALSSFNPAVFALNEMLKQQLAMTQRFMERSRHLHSGLVRSLEPPAYRYTTLEDTKEYIRKRTSPKLTMDQALEDVLQEMRDYHHI